MGKDTRIRWASDTWNAMTGCTKVSPGCDHCYAETIALRWGPTSAAYPFGFTPTFKANKLPLPAALARKHPDGRVIFTNSMSDVMHADFSTEQRDQVFDVMLTVGVHEYLVLTKRPKTLAQYLNGSRRQKGWLARRGLDRVPANIWLGTSIESNEYVWRADWLRDIDVPVRFLSCEPLLGPLPDLNLDGIGWVIVGGESGKGFRPMDHAWARDLRDRCLARQPEWIGPEPWTPRPIQEIDPMPSIPAFYFKQSAAYITERGVELDGRRWQQYPLIRMHRPAVAELVGRTDGLVGTGAQEDAEPQPQGEGALF